MKNAICAKCMKDVDSSRSAFCIIVNSNENKAIARTVSSREASKGTVVIHVNGDRECGKTIAMFRKQVCEMLKVSGDADLSFLDYM